MSNFTFVVWIPLYLFLPPCVNLFSSSFESPALQNKLSSPKHPIFKPWNFDDCDPCIWNRFHINVHKQAFLTPNRADLAWSYSWSVNIKNRSVTLCEVSAESPLRSWSIFNLYSIYFFVLFFCLKFIFSILLYDVYIVLLFCIFWSSYRSSGFGHQLIGIFSSWSFNPSTKKTATCLRVNRQRRSFQEDIGLAALQAAVRFCFIPSTLSPINCGCRFKSEEEIGWSWGGLVSVYLSTPRVVGSHKESCGI